MSKTEYNQCDCYGQEQYWKARFKECAKLYDEALEAKGILELKVALLGLRQTLQGATIKTQASLAA